MKVLNEMSIEEMILLVDWRGAQESSAQALEARLKSELSKALSLDEMIGVYERSHEKWGVN